MLLYYVSYNKMKFFPDIISGNVQQILDPHIIIFIIILSLCCIIVQMSDSLAHPKQQRTL